MKPRISSLVPFAALLLAGACQNNPSHWDPDHAPERASFHALAANGSSDETITETTRENSREITLLARRHFFNDNPDNPLQSHRDNTFGRYVPIWDMPVNAVLDTTEMVGYGLVRTGQGLWGGLLMFPQVVLGTSDVEAYDEPPPPSDFKVKNR